MTTPDQPPTEAAFFTAIRGWDIVRGPQGIIGGVAAALGARIGLAPWPTRLLMILAAIIVFPVVMIAYAAGWALLPDADGNIVIQNFGRGVTNVGALIGIGVIGLVGFFSLSNFNPFGPDWFGPSISAVDAGNPVRLAFVMFAVLVPIAVIVGVVALIVYFARRSSRGNAPEGAEPVYALTPAQARSAAGTASPSTGTSGATAVAPVATAKAAQPKRPAPPRVPGPGRGFYLALLSWLLLSIASVAWAARENLLAIYPVLAWGMVFLTGLGVLMIAVSLTGRRLGFMGFLGVVGVIAASLLLVRHDDLLDWYASKPDITVASVEDLVSTDPIDVRAEFGGDYQDVYFAEACWPETYKENPLDIDSTGAHITVPDPTETSADHDILSGTTTVSIPRGTSIELVAQGWAQTEVYFADRDVWCIFWSGDGPYMQLTNPGEPVVTLTVSDEYAESTIIIEEN